MSTNGNISTSIDESYLGIGAKSLQVGDEAWVLAGCRYPLILRFIETENEVTEDIYSADDTQVEMEGPELRVYNLVGTAYIHGIMNGEAATDETAFTTITIE